MFEFISNFYSVGALSVFYIQIDVFLLVWIFALLIMYHSYKYGIGKYKEMPESMHEYKLPPYIRNSSPEVWDEILKLRSAMIWKAFIVMLIVAPSLIIMSYIFSKFKFIFLLIKWIFFLSGGIYIVYSALKINKKFRPKDYKYGWKDFVNRCN